MSESILKTKSYDFALLIVEIYKSISNVKNEYVLSRQLLKSGTLVGANIRETEFAQSSKDFINKMSIALKEVNETVYWLLLLRDTNYIVSKPFNKLADFNKQLIKMLVSTINTMKSKLK